MIEITVAGIPAECRDTIYRLRLASGLYISTIYEQDVETETHASYFLILDMVGNPRWSLENLPDPGGFFEAVRRYSWPSEYPEGLL